MFQTDWGIFSNCRLKCGAHSTLHPSPTKISIGVLLTIMWKLKKNMDTNK